MSDNIPGLGWTKTKGVYQHGKRALKVPMSLHRAARAKLLEKLESAGINAGIVLLEGGKQLNQYDTDTEPVFRQDSWFNFLFGVVESEFYAAIDIASGVCTLFMPRLPDVYRIWCGSIYPPEHFQSMYDVDSVLYADTLEEYLAKTLLPGNQIFLMEGMYVVWYKFRIINELIFL
jgi:Xaa-Pro dipeptidase